MQPSKYLAGYPQEVIAKAQALIEQDRVGAVLQDKYGQAHLVHTDSQLRDYVHALSDRHMRKASPLGKVIYDSKLQVMKHALGTQTTISRVQGARLKVSREIRIASVFRTVPADFLKMIVEHELAWMM